MFSISVLELLLMVVVLPLLGGVIGFAVGSDRARRDDQEDKVEALQAEFDEYRGGVTSHFEKTAAVMQQMTEQYRSLYVHMAQSSVDLCGAPDDLPQLEEFKRPGLGTDPAPNETDSKDTAAAEDKTAS